MDWEDRIRFVENIEPKSAVARVLVHCSPEIRDAIVESIEDSIEEKKMRFMGVQACLAPAGGNDFNGCSDSVTIAAAYLHEYPGRIAGLVGPSRPGLSRMESEVEPRLRSDPLKIAVAVVQRLIEHGWNWSLEMIQSIVEPDADSDRDALAQTGFRKLAELIQMQCSLEVDDSDLFPSAETLEGEWRAYRHEDRQLWIDWLNATYNDTLDCPELNGLRSTDSTLNGYMAAAQLPRYLQSDAARVNAGQPIWWGLFASDHLTAPPIAGVMLSPTSEHVWELTYMGVSSSHRGKSLGQATLGRAIQAARDVGAKKIWLAVDARNTVALKLYQSYGFRELRRLEAWIIARPKP